MTDLAHALNTDPDKMQPFEGRQVISAAIEIPNAAGGLRDAMKIDPVELRHDQEGHIVLHWKVRKVRFDEIKDTAALTRVMVLDVDEAAFIDGDMVAEVLSDQRLRIEAAKEAAATEARRAKGEFTLDDEALLAEHEQGQHTDLRDGCPSCDAERVAAAEESADALPTVPVPPPGDELAPRRQPQKPRGTTKKAAT